MKKFLIINFLIVSFFASTYTTHAKELINANGIKINEQEYNNLISMAFSDEDIYLMSEEEFNNNKDKIGIKTISNTSYIKTEAIIDKKLYNTNNINDETKIIYKDYYLTEEEMKQELLNDSTLKYNINSSSVIETTYKKLKASITTYKTDGGWINYRSRADLEWLKMPKVTSEDKIRVHVTDGFMGDEDTRYGAQINKINGKYETITYGKNSSKWEDVFEENEEILKPNLVNGTGVTERRIYMYFDAYQYYPDIYSYYRAEAGYNHKTSFNEYDGWLITTADMAL